MTGELRPAFDTYASVVPTIRGRSARAVERTAGRRWPGLRRPQLLVRLTLEVYRAAQPARQLRRTRRIAAVKKHGGTFTGSYGPGYLSKLREDWPE